MAERRRKVRPSDDPIVRASHLNAWAELMNGFEARLTIIERVLAEVLEAQQEVEDALFEYDPEPTEDELDAAYDGDDRPVYGVPDVDYDEDTGATEFLLDPEGEVVPDPLAPQVAAEQVAEDGTVVQSLVPPDPEDEATKERRQRNAIRRMERAAEGVDEDGPKARIIYEDNPAAAALGGDYAAPGAGALGAKDPGGRQLHAAEGPQGEEGWSGDAA